MKAKQILEQNVGNADICVAVLDGPVDLAHPCFNKAKITTVDTLVSNVADNGPSTHHGTHVASLIFGQPDSSIRGISPNCRGLIIPVFADGPNNSIAPCSQIDLAHAITQAVEQGAHIINISGGELVSSEETHPLLGKAVRLCAENGILIVAAVGNEGCRCFHVPAVISSTLAVGAMDAHGRPLDFSNWGEAYQNNGILALGENILGAIPGGGVAAKSGTSFATPIVSGIIALLLSIQIRGGDKPDPCAVRAALLQSAHPCFPSDGLDCYRYLKGRLNIVGAYNLITKRQLPETDSSSSVQKAQMIGSIGLVESSKRLPVLNMQNTENSKIAPVFIHNSALDLSKALENADSIELKSIDKEKSKKIRKQMLEENMTELIDENCDLSKGQLKADEIKMLNIETSKDTETTPSVHESDVQVAELGTTNQEVVAPAVMPAQIPPTQACGRKSLVYALGMLSYDFGSEARQDSFVQKMEEPDKPKPNVYDPTQLLPFLKKSPEYAEALIWTLELDSTPIYAIRPAGSFASKAYERLCEFLESQINKNVDRVSIPGVVVGNIKLFSGQVLPVIVPELRGMHSWNTSALIEAVQSQLPYNAAEPKKSACLYQEDELRNYLNRLYYELRNLGRTSQERAMNYAGTDAFHAGKTFENASKCGMELDRIECERSPICRPDSDCWDVKLTFFDPKNRLTVARKVYRYTIDVSDVIPVTVGEIRTWDVF